MKFFIKNLEHIEKLKEVDNAKDLYIMPNVI
jgi:hypothetical protein